MLETLRSKAQYVDEPAERTELLLRQGQLCAEKLDDVPTAIECYEEVLDELPSADVYLGLEQLYTRAERWDDLSSMFERQIDAETGDVVRVQVGELVLENPVE